MKKLKEERHYESVKVPYTVEEKAQIADDMARETQALFDLESRKKEVTADLGGQMRIIEGVIADLVKRYNNGYELRDVEVLEVMDEPVPGMKKIIRLDTNQTLREAAMTPEDLQRSFGFGAA